MNDFFNNRGIKWGGSYTPSYLTSIIGNKPYNNNVDSNTERVVNDIMPKILSDKLDVSEDVFAGLNIEHTSTQHAQSVVRSMNTIRSNKRDYSFASIDIETVGTPSIHDKNAKFFSITEYGISNWKLNGNLEMSKMTQDGLSLVGSLNKRTENELNKLVSDIKSGIKDPYSLTIDEKRSLRDLLKYKDSAAFGVQDIQVDKNKWIQMRVFRPGDSLKLPLNTFNAKDYANELVAALGNLSNNRNDDVSIAKALKFQLNKVDGVIGHNILGFDMPVMANYFADAGQSGFVNTLKGFVKGRGNKVILDTQAIIDYSFPDMISSMAGTMSEEGRTKYIMNRGKQLTNDLLNRVYGFQDAYSHTALADSMVAPQVFNKISSSIDKALGELQANQVIVKGNKFFSRSGTAGFELGPFDSVYRLVEGKFVGAYNNEYNKVSRGGLYKSTNYEVMGIQHISAKNNPFGHQYGSNMLVLRNLDDDLYHTFVREDNAAGTGIGQLQTLINKHLAPVSGTSYESYMRNLTNEDKGMRRYRGLFESTTSYDKTKSWYGLANKLRDAKDAEIAEEEFAGFTKAQKRDFLTIRGRLASEYSFMKDIFAGIDDGMQKGMISNTGARGALISLRNIMEDRENIYGLKVEKSLEEVLTSPENRAINMENGILKLGTKAEIISSLRALANNAGGINQSGIIKLLFELRKKGYITREEETKFAQWATSQNNKNYVIRELSSILATRTTMANALLEGKTVQGNIEAAKKIGNDFKSIYVSTSKKGWDQSWFNMSADARTSITNHVLESGIRGTAMSYVNREMMPWQTVINNSNPDLMRIINQHDNFVKEQLNWATSNRISRPTTVMNDLERLAGAYISNGTNVRFIKGSNDNLIQMAVFRRSQTQTMENLSAAELLRHKDAVILNIPLANSGGILQYERAKKVNRMYLMATGEAGNPLAIHTATNKIVQKYVSYAQRTVALLNAEGTPADIREYTARAKNRSSTAFNKVFTTLGGVSDTEIEEERMFGKISRMSESALRWRSKLLDISGAYSVLGEKGKSFKDLDINQKKLYLMNASKRLRDEFGVDLKSLGNLKESTADIHNPVLATGDIRRIFPFAQYNPITSQILIQNLNLAQVDRESIINAGRGERLNPLAMTREGEIFFNIRENGLPGGLSLKAMYVQPKDMADLFEQEAGKEYLSTYEGRSVISETAAKDLKRTEILDFVVDSHTVDSKIEVGAVIPANSGTLIGSTYKEGVRVSSYIWDKGQDFVVTDVEDNGYGKTQVSGYRVLPFMNGNKLTDTGDKSTGTIAKEEQMRALGVDYIKARAAEAKGMHGEILASQARLIMQEVNQLTVGEGQKNSIRESIVKYYNEFFSKQGMEGAGFSLGRYGRDAYLVVPEVLSASKGYFNYKDLYTQVYSRVNQSIADAGVADYNLLSKLSGQIERNGRRFNVLYGVEIVGTPNNMELWQHAAGFDREGIVKFGPKVREILALNGLEETSKELFKFAMEDMEQEMSFATDKVTSRGLERGLIGKYYDALHNIATGSTSTKDVYVRLNKMTGSEYEVGIESFNRIPSISKDEPHTMERLRGTIHDLGGIIDSGADIDGLDRRVAKQALNRGSIILQLPRAYTVGGQLRDSIRLAVGEARTTMAGSQVVEMDSLVKASGAVMTAVQNILAGPEKNPGFGMEDLYNALGERIKDYEAEVTKGISSSAGWIQKNGLTQKLKGSGFLVASSFDPFQKIKGGYVPTGVVAVTEDYFAQLFSGVGEKEYEALKSIATWDEVIKGERGVYGLMGRYPETSKYSEFVSQIVIDNSVGNNAVGKMTVGDWIRAAGDNDGDIAPIIVTHYRGKRVDEILNVDSNKVLKELKENRNASLDERMAVDNIIRRQMSSAEGYSIENLKKKKFLERTAYDAEATFARVIRSDIGTASNFNTSLRRMAGIVAKLDTGVFSKIDQEVISNFGELFEQSPTSGKHSSFENIIKNMKGIKDGQAFDLTMATDEEYNQAMKIIDERLTVGSSMKDAFMKGDKTAFFKANRVLQVFDQSISKEDINSILYGDQVKGKVGIRQRFTSDELWDARERLFSVIDEDRTLTSFGTRTGVKDPVKLYGLMFGDNGNYNELLGDMRSLDNIDSKDRIASFQERLADRATQFKGGYEPLGLSKPFENLDLGATQAMRDIKIGGLTGGLLAFSGLMLGAGLGGGMSSDDHNIQIGEGGYAVQQPVANIPGPSARVIRDGTGYESMNISIKARDMAGMSEEEIGALVQQEISGMMPMDVNFNITKKDNSQKLDSIWVQNVMNDVASKGYAL